MSLHPARLALSARNTERLRASELRVVVTGATGWLGQAALEMVDSALESGLQPRVEAFASRARKLALRSGREINVRALADIARLPRMPTLLLHFAYLTKDRTFGLSKEEFDRLNENIREQVGAVAANIGVSHILLPSSGAVYGLPTRPDRSLQEEAAGNPYGAQKVKDECYFRSLARKHCMRIAIARVFSLAGPFINKYDGYALSSIIYAVLRGRQISLRANRRVLRSYTHVRDLLDVSISWLFSGSEPNELVFDTQGSPAIEVGELADMIRCELKRANVPIERPPLESYPDDRFLGDGRIFAALAAEHGIALADLATQIRETVDYMACNLHSAFEEGRSSEFS